LAQHILIVTGDPTSQSRLIDALRLEGYQTTTLRDGKSAIDLVADQGLPHLAVIEPAWPGTKGLELSSHLTSRSVPVILMAENSAQTAIESLLWADDFVRLPVDPQEIVARIQVVLRRVSDQRYAEDPLRVIDNRLSIDYRSNALIVEGKAVHLTSIESRLLHLLLWHRGSTVDYRTFLLRIWPAGGVYEDTLRVHMHRLRAKLEIDPRKPKYIVTQRAMGYSFRAERREEHDG
jgi:DNA-binding response OmpR family regulator